MKNIFFVLSFLFYSLSYGQRVALLGRNPEAQKFIQAAGITDFTQEQASNTLTVQLKMFSLWTKMYAIYPVVGSTATTDKYNLKDPRDLDAAYRITFNGSWTHASTGMTGGGGSGDYAETHFTATTATANSSAVGIYLRTNGNTAVFQLPIGAYDGTTIMQLNMSPVFYGANTVLGDLTSTASYSTSDVRGLNIGSRQSSTDLKLYFNATQQATDGTTNTGNLPNATIWIGARHDLGGAVLPSTQEMYLPFISSGLSATDVTNLSYIFDAFKTTLGR